MAISRVMAAPISEVMLPIDEKTLPRCSNWWISVMQQYLCAFELRDQLRRYK